MNVPDTCLSKTSSAYPIGDRGDCGDAWSRKCHAVPRTNLGQVPGADGKLAGYHDVVLIFSEGRNLVADPFRLDAPRLRCGIITDIREHACAHESECEFDSAESSGSCKCIGFNYGYQSLIGKASQPQSNSSLAYQIQFLMGREGALEVEKPPRDSSRLLKVAKGGVSIKSSFKCVSCSVITLVPVAKLFPPHRVPMRGACCLGDRKASLGRARREADDCLKRWRIESN